jgi:cyclic beta-1,2-glucan synthetase
MSIDPCVPSVWPEYRLDWRIGSTRYRFVVHNPDSCTRGIASATLDGVAIDAHSIPLQQDGREHEVHVVLGVAKPLEQLADVQRDGAVRGASDR